ncbi:MAG: citryl-CoA lyase [Acidimicrobiia bacterium]|nr:citryl-CoA lyase [Acidimicrobiia bacterium]MYF84196.1 citryl-CoA lyase [Acidimicrobiia bacterium]
MAGLADASGDRITVHGLDLAEELIGSTSFASMLYLLTIGELPERSVESMIDAMLVTVAEHGLTPSAITARLTYRGAPDSLQGAVAAGLLGAGPALLGTAEQAAGMLARLVSDSTAETREQVVSQSVAAWLREGAVIPGFGHPIHRDGDARVAALRRVQTDQRLPEEHFLTAVLVESALSEAKGRTVPMNAAGAIGAIVSDMRLPPRFARGLSIVARSAGLLAHVMEEASHPIADRIWKDTRSRSSNPGQP